MDHFKLLLWLGLLFFRTEASVQRLSIQPEDEVVLVNSRVILPCRVSDKIGILQWKKDDIVFGTDRNLSAWERYKIIGNQTSGDYYLEIYPVLLEDEGKYQCQVSAGSDSEQEIKSNLATLTVRVPPEPPRIVQGNYLVAYENVQIQLECISYGGKPAAAINWIDNSGTQLINGINYTVQVLPDGKRFLIKSILTINPKLENQNSTFTCQTQNAAERTPQSAQLKLDVKYPPHVTVAILSGAETNGFIPEGTDARLGCHTQANPSAMTYQWFLNDKMIDGNFTTELLLKHVTRKYHNTTVKCKISHEYGKREAGEILYISTSPQFRGKPQSVVAVLDENVTLCCDVVGRPLPDITWLLVDSSQIVGHDANLSLAVTLNTVGRYKCKAHVPGFTDIETVATVSLKGHPNIISPQTQFGVKGTTVSVECTAHSIPPPTEILWTWNYTTTTVRGEEYTILEEPLPEGMKSTLIIRDSQDRHFRLYICRVTNSYGTDFLEINLKPEETFSFMALLNIVMITHLILAAVLVAIAIFWCRRCRMRKASVNVNSNKIENQLKESNESINIFPGKLEWKTDCIPSNPPESETETLPDPHVKNDVHEAIENRDIDYWPPPPNLNCDELQDPPLQLPTNSDLNNLPIALPVRNKPQIPPRSSSIYVQVGYSKKSDLATVYE